MGRNCAWSSYTLQYLTLHPGSISIDPNKGTFHWESMMSLIMPSVLHGQVYIQGRRSTPNNEENLPDTTSIPTCAAMNCSLTILASQFDPCSGISFLGHVWKRPEILVKHSTKGWFGWSVKSLSNVLILIWQEMQRSSQWSHIALMGSFRAPFREGSGAAVSEYNAVGPKFSSPHSQRNSHACLASLPSL